MDALLTGYEQINMLTIYAALIIRLCNCYYYEFPWIPYKNMLTFTKIVKHKESIILL